MPDASIRGKIWGAVRIMTVRDTIVVPVEAQAAEDSRDMGFGGAAESSESVRGVSGCAW